MDYVEHYSYRVHWSPEDEEFVGTVAEFPSLSWLAPSAEEALEGIRGVCAEVVADMELAGERIPEPFVDRSYSGRILLRIPPEAHRRLAVEAAEQNVSLNRLLASRVGA